MSSGFLFLIGIGDDVLLGSRLWDHAQMSWDSYDPRHREHLRGIVLLLEAEAVAANALAALRLMDAYPSTSDASTDPVFACLSMAMERALKLTIGLSAVEESKKWPAKEEMNRSPRGHHIAKMDAEVKASIERRLSHATNPGFVLRAVEELEVDPVAPIIVDAMQRYATSGRFDRLDLLAEGPGEAESPGEIWRSIEQGVKDADPTLVSVTVSLIEFPSRWQIETARAIRVGVRAWFRVIYMSWVQGVFGAQAASLAGTLNPILGATARS